MTKTLDDYMELPYTIELQNYPSEGWFVRVKELPGCMSQGDSSEEALEMINDAMRGWLDVALEEGISIPEPRLDDDYSGKFNLRVPKSTHRKLVDLAEREGVSLNSFCISTLSEAVGGNKPISQQAEANRLKEDINGSLKRICYAAGINQTNEPVNESAFSDWFHQEIDGIFEMYRSGEINQASNHLYYIIKIFSNAGNSSPLILSVADLLTKMRQTLDRSMNVMLSPSSSVFMGINDIIEEVHEKKIIIRERPKAQHWINPKNEEDARDTEETEQFEQMAIAHKLKP